MNSHIVKDKIRENPKSLNMKVSINMDDGKNKVDKIIDEFAESERLKEGVNKIKQGAVATTKFSISFVTVGLIIFVILVALGIIT